MMLRNTLSLILVERQLRITRVSNDTGISRTTLTALSQNSNKMIQMETINTLCNYLKLSPSDLFEYVPFDFSYSAGIDKEFPQTDNSYSEYELSGFINIKDRNGKKNTISFAGNCLFAPFAGHTGNPLVSVEMKPRESKEEAVLKQYVNKLSVSFLTDVKQQFSSVILKAATDHLNIKETVDPDIKITFPK